MTALTAQQRADRALSESDFLRQVTDLAELLGWAWVHFRPAQTQRGWRTPVQGPLGKGWPDLVLVRARDRRLIFAELKREGQKPTVEQAAVLDLLGIMLPRTGNHPVVEQPEAYLWHPSDFDWISEVLR